MSIQLFFLSLYVQATELNYCHDKSIVFGLNWPSLLPNSQIFLQFWLSFLIVTKSLFTVLKPLTYPTSYIAPQSQHVTSLTFYDAKKVKICKWELSIFVQPHRRAYQHLHLYWPSSFCFQEDTCPFLCRKHLHLCSPSYYIPDSSGNLYHQISFSFYLQLFLLSMLFADSILSLYD